MRILGLLTVLEQSLTSTHGMPFVSLLAPEAVPPVLQSQFDGAGSVFTLFLQAPLETFCRICGRSDMVLSQHATLTKRFNRLRALLLAALSSLSGSQEPIAQFCGDPFGRRVLSGFAFSLLVLSSLRCVPDKEVCDGVMV
jgi:hypothetical protein